MKNCLECGEKIVGREDKKFCSDGCRNAYNNKINKDSNNYMRNINNKLRKNYRILSELNIEGKSKTTRAKLFSKGFDFDFFTNILNTKTGNTYYFLYDQGYMLLDNDYYMLVKRYLIPHPQFPKYEKKSFLPFCRYFYSSNSGNTFSYDDAAVDLR
jgi:predicted nucleic acid-binding Zn ribbon protein